MLLFRQVVVPTSATFSYAARSNEGLYKVSSAQTTGGDDDHDKDDKMAITTISCTIIVVFPPIFLPPKRDAQECAALGLTKPNGSIFNKKKDRKARLAMHHTTHVTRRTSHVTRRTSHVTRHMSHIIRHTSHVTRHTSHVTCRFTCDT
jgi:hypothetical protein